MTSKLRLGVNIDHVATIRNARGGKHPDPVQDGELIDPPVRDALSLERELHGEHRIRCGDGVESGPHAQTLSSGSSSPRRLSIGV